MEIYKRSIICMKSFKLMIDRSLKTFLKNLKLRLREAKIEEDLNSRTFSIIDR